MAKERRSSEERRLEIAETALMIIATEGANKLTLAHLGKIIGMRDAGVLRHYKDKKAIIKAATGLFAELLNEDLLEEESSALENLKVFFIRRLKKIRERPELLDLVFNHRLLDLIGEEYFQKHIQKSFKFVTKLISRLEQEQLLRMHVTPNIAVWTLVGIFRGASKRNTATGLNKISPEELWRSYCIMLCK